MAGEPRTNQFNLSTATLMLAPMADQLTINPDAHSIGLVKNVQVTADPQFVELTYGQANTVVMSVKNQNGLKVSAEVYEYTPRNIAYLLGLNVTSGAFAANTTTFVPTASIAAGATTLTLPGNVTAQFPNGAWFFIQTNAGGRDIVHLARVVSSAFATNTTITFTGYPVPTGVTFNTATTRVGVINKLDMISEIDNFTFSCRITGLMAVDKRPIIIHMPKVKVTRGFNVNFSTDNFGNLPMELTPYQPIVGDAGYSTDFTEALSIFPGA